MAVPRWSILACSLSGDAYQAANSATKTAVPVYRCASKLSVLVHHDYCCAGHAISNRGHPLNADIAVDIRSSSGRHEIALQFRNAHAPAERRPDATP